MHSRVHGIPPCDVDQTWLREGAAGHVAPCVLAVLSRAASRAPLRRHGSPTCRRRAAKARRLAPSSALRGRGQRRRAPAAEPSTSTVRSGAPPAHEWKSRLKESNARMRGAGQLL
eukprot:5550115-Pleurochrysis_carterae.AAC.6